MKVAQNYLEHTMVKFEIKQKSLTHVDLTLVSVFSRATNPTSPPRISRIRDQIHSSAVRERKSKRQGRNSVQGFGRVTRRLRAN
jgi:hypothetical protein